jgi:hypothetical protein
MRRFAVLANACVAVVLLSSGTALAKREAPTEVPPVVIDGIKYAAPHFANPCGQNGGCVVASDAATGAQLWFVKVYCVTYQPAYEMDVQDVFIETLAAGGAGLLITNEIGHRFTLDLKTRAVTGDLQGCETIHGTDRVLGGGCTYGRGRPGGAPLWLLALPLVAAFCASRSRRPG